MGKYGKLRTLAAGVSLVGAQDLGRALRFAEHAQAVTDLPTFLGELVPELRQLVDCDWVGYNEIDFQREQAVVASNARRFDGMEERFFALAVQHPLLMRRRQGHLQTCMFSDFLTARQLHRLELYQDFYRLREIEDQVSIGLHGETSVTIALSRSRRGFGERDRRLLELIRPHLSLAHTRARRETQLKTLLAALANAPGEERTAVVQLDASGDIEFVGAARELLETYCRPTPDPDAPPVELVRWLRTLPQTSATSNVLVLERDRARLRIREHPGHAPDGSRTFVLVEQQRMRVPDVNALRSRGLTERQAQVLSLVAQGMQNQQIAAKLQISAGTVAKHLENIYARLGVSCRTEAVARVQSF